jgi:hypothetical protein
VALLITAYQKPFSPDWILFTHCLNTEYCDVYRLHPDTQFTRKIGKINNLNGSETYAMVDIRGEWIYFSYFVGETRHEYRLHTTDFHRQDLPAISGGMEIQQISPDGQWVLWLNRDYATDPISIYRMRTRDGILIPWLSASPKEYGLDNILWLGNSQGVIFKRRGQFFSLNLEDHIPQRILQNFEGLDLVSATPDGQAVLGVGSVYDKKGLWRIDLATNTPHLIKPIHQFLWESWYRRQPT